MLGEAISAQAPGHAGLRALASEHGGPRPAGVRPEETQAPCGESRTARATRP